MKLTAEQKTKMTKAIKVPETQEERLESLKYKCKDNGIFLAENSYIERVPEDKKARFSAILTYELASEYIFNDDWAELMKLIPAKARLLKMKKPHLFMAEIRDHLGKDARVVRIEEVWMITRLKDNAKLYIWDQYLKENLSALIIQDEKNYDHGLRVHSQVLRVEYSADPYKEEDKEKVIEELKEAFDFIDWAFKELNPTDIRDIGKVKKRIARDKARKRVSLAREDHPKAKERYEKNPTKENAVAWAKSAEELMAAEEDDPEATPHDYW